MRALTLQNLRRFEEALADNKRAHAPAPENADACQNTGNVLRALFRHEVAIDWYDKSLTLRPNSRATLGNKAVADYRWLLDRDDSPWYPTALLFRQTEPGNFAGVVERVRGELSALVAGWSPAGAKN
jgi:tetratricopeptide (TPR) repeat protein